MVTSGLVSISVANPDGGSICLGSGSISQRSGSGSFFHHYDFLSLKSDVNEPFKSNKHNKQKNYFRGSGSVANFHGFTTLVSMTETVRSAVLRPYPGGRSAGQLVSHHRNWTSGYPSARSSRQTQLNTDRESNLADLWKKEIQIFNVWAELRDQVRGVKGSKTVEVQRFFVLPCDPRYRYNS